MPYLFNFFPDHHLACITFYGKVTLEDAREGQQRLIEALAQVVTPIHALVDLRSMQEFPTSLTLLKEAMSPIKSDKLHWLILITNSNRLVKYIGSILMQVLISGVRLRMFDSLEQALEFLTDADPSMGDITEILPKIEREI